MRRTFDEADAILIGWDAAAPATIDRLRKTGRATPIIALLDVADEERIVEALRCGARDAVTLARIQRLPAALAAAVEASTEMRISETLFRSLWETEIFLITIVGTGAKILDANPGFLRALGYTRDELKRLTWAALTPPQYEATDEVTRQQLLATGVARPWRKGLTARDGRVVPVLASAVLLPGVPPQLIAFAIDLTQQQRIDDALLERARLAAAIAEVTLAAAEATSLEAMLARATATIQSALGAETVQIWLTERGQLVQRAYRGAGDRPLDQLVAFPLPDRLGVLGLAVTKPLDDAGHQDVTTLANQLALGIRRVRDARATADLEAQLRQAQKLEAIGTLAGGVAHDFNNLLSVIIGYADLLREGLAAESDLRGDVDEISAAADRAKALTAQLLAFSRRQVLQPRVIQLEELVAKLLPMLRRLVPESIELVPRLAPATVRADPHQLEQVLMNLVVNARDACGSRGEITISIVRDGAVHIAVADTGTGMDEETRTRIFEPFFTTKAQGKGTGLGLSTVFGIVEQSGGTIAVASELGRGTTFTISLPFATPTVAMEPLQAPEPSSLHGTETILTCEDEPQLRTLVHAVLTRHGYRVLSARTGEEALAFAAASGGVDLLVTDVIMPGMSGRELADELRARDEDLRVMFMSGYTDDELVHAGVSEQSVAFLQKPIHPEALARKVRELLDLRR